MDGQSEGQRGEPRVIINMDQAGTGQSMPIESVITPQTDGTASSRRNVDEVHPTQAREDIGTLPSPFLQSMVRVADRIVQGPVLDLASSLGVHEEEQESAPRVHTRGSRGSLDGQQTRATSTDQGGWRDFGSVRPQSSQNTAMSVPIWSATAERITSASHLGDLASRAGSFQRSREVQINFSRRPASSTESLITRELSSGSEYSRLSERSNEARRGLERALRDYRLARRALRAHHDETNETRAEAQEISSVRYSRLQEHETLADAIASLSDSNHATSSSVPTAAALRAARLSMQRSAALDTGDRPTYASVAGSSSASNVAQERDRDSSRSQTQRISIIRDLPRRFDWQRNDPSVIISQAQDDPVSEDLENSGARPADLNADSRRRLDASLLRSRLRNQRIEDTPSRRKAKNTMRYLTELKNAEKDGQSTVAMAERMGIDSLKESLEKAVVFDLPLRVDELPRPSKSCWLESGVKWSGQQVSCTARPNSTAAQPRTSTRPVWAQSVAGRGDETDRLLSIRARRHRERVRAERLEREQQLQGWASTSDSSWRTFSGVPLAGSMEILADVERHLSDLLEEESQRLNPVDDWTMPESLLGRQRIRRENSAPATVQDVWPVKVALHEVDWDRMTVKGTMSASQIPNKTKVGLSHDVELQEERSSSKCVESFFDGEIIDFRMNEIETLGNKKEYKIGGLGTDLQYWSGLGPFRQEVERQRNVIRYEKQMKRDLGNDEAESGKAVLEVIKTGTLDSYESIVQSLRDCSMMDETELEQEENERAVDEAMVKCLGSKRWLEEKLGIEWVLMRWKERCFVDPTSHTTTFDATVQSQGQQATTLVPESNTTGRSHSPRIQPNESAASWGLTISGFYYIALHRQTGKIEGMYYDPGSQPYQRLEMWPQDYHKQSSNVSRPSQNRRNSPPVQVEDDIGSGSGSGSGSGWSDIDVRKDVVGVRKWFPAIEFRD